MMKRTFVVAIAAGMLAAGAGFQPAGAQAPASGPTLRSSATAIVVDVVVRDRKGVPVTDLTAADFELYEDGVRQTIGAVTLATARPPSGSVTVESTGTDAGTSRSGPAAQTSVTALVFDSLTAEGRAAARRAALSLAASLRPDSDRFGVFVSETPPRVLQTYTADVAAVRRAIDAAASAVLEKGSPAGRARGTLDASASPTAGAESRGRPDRAGEITQAEIDAAARPVLRNGRLENDPGLVGELMIERTTQRMDEAYREFQRDGFGHAATTSLLAIVTSLAPLPGRKSVVFFAEDFAVPDAAASRFQAIIDTANRANVAIYTVDAAGLRVHSRRAETSREIAAIGRRGVGDADRDANQPYTRDFERNEDVLRQDPSASLGLLARQTGGLLIDDTNDLATAARRIDADRRFHYLLTYAPANATFTGEYRRIQVRVPRRAVDVRARPGYVATAGPPSAPALRYEAAALKALARPRLPTDLVVRGRAFAFPRADGTVAAAIVVALTAGDAGHWVDRATQRYRTDFTILARLTDAGGRLVWTGSQPYVLTGPIADVDRARAGDVLFFRQATIAPGTYTFEYVVHDALTERAGAGREEVVIAASPSDRLSAGSLVIVRQAEAIAGAEHAADNPFHAGDLVLTPNVGEPVRKARRERLALYVHVRPARRPVRAELELRRLDLPIVSVPLDPPAADGDGTLRYLIAMPLADVDPGPCELRLRLDDGVTTLTRNAAFILDP
jgi:VWFA-related protein